MNTATLDPMQTTKIVGDFHAFATRIHARYTDLAKGELFTVGTTDGIFEHYLSSFPVGTNPIYKTRTEHDCSCCKNFVRNLGRVVSISDGTVRTVWDVQGLEYPFNEVAASMAAFVRSQPITSIFRTKGPSYGAESTRQLLEDGTVKRWNHFHGKVAFTHLNTSPDESRGTFNTAAHVFRRGLEELKPDALQTVLDLIGSKALYRGEEHLPAVKGFRDLQRAYMVCADEQARAIFVFANATSLGARFRNTVIGTLVQDLSAGVDLEHAMKSFETKVAPTNYKRTTALITPRMVQDAMKTIEELGLEPALQRRLANLSDISVSNVLWVDRSAQAKMKGGIADVLMAATTSTPADGKATEIGIDTFMTDILPTAVAVDLYLRNTHLTNFVTLTAPVNPDTGKLLRWANDFAWSYDGNITDSIREKVKAAGGNVDAKLRFSLAWYNHDDLDIHVREPNGNHIYFGYKDGKLDVDMNCGFGPRGALTRQPVENVSFARPLDGIYKVWVHQYSRRETNDVGFSIEVASERGTAQLSYPKGVTTEVQVGAFKVVGGAIVEAAYGPGILGTGIAQTKWGLKTEGMVKVQTVMFSPNYWDDNAVGNKHWFFMLDGCRVEEPMRGIYNEFLSPALEKHRKVFEVLGDKSKCPPTDDQLSGLGFSSTRGDTVTVSVKTDRSTRLYNIRF